MPNAVSKAAQRFKGAPKSIRLATYAVSAYAAYAVVLGVITPAVLEAKTPEKLSELLGRQVSLQQVSINPFTLRSRIDGFAIRESDGNSDFVRFDRLEVEIDFWKSLFSLTPTVNHVYLQAPDVSLQRLSEGKATRFNFTSMMESIAEHSSSDAQQKPEPNAASSIPAFRVLSVTLSGGTLHFDDKVTGAKLGYKNMDFRLSQLDSRAFTLNIPDGQPDAQLTPQANQYTYSVQGADNSQLTLDGQFQLTPLEVKGEVKLSDLTLPPFWPFAADKIQAALTQGRLSVTGRYQAAQSGDRFDYSLQKGAVKLRDVVVSAQKEPKIKLPELNVEGIALNSRTQAVDIQSINLRGLQANSAFTPQGLDLQSLLTPADKSAASPAPSKTPGTLSAAPEGEQLAGHNTETGKTKPDASAPAWRVTVNRFAMTDTDLNVKESAVSKGVFWRIYPLSVTTGPLVSDLSKPVDFDIDLAISSDTHSRPDAARGTLKAVGSLDAKTVTTRGHLTLSDLDLNQAQPYLTPYLNLQTLKGKLSTDGDFNADGKGNTTYQGSADLNNLLIADAIEKQPLVKWQKMNMDSFSFDSAQNRLNINTILFNQPYAKIIIAKDKRTNIGDIVVKNASQGAKNAAPSKSAPASASAKKQSGQSAGKPLTININAIKFANGSAFFADNSLTPNFSTGIESLQGSIRHLSSVPGTKAQVDIKGKIDKYAPVTLKGEINPLIEKPYLDLDLMFKSVKLTSVNPYSGTYAGYYIDKGQMSLSNHPIFN